MLIGLTGYAQHGKDTVASQLVADYAFTKMAFADKLRQLAAEVNPVIDVEEGVGVVRYADVIEWYGYEQAKTMVPEVRRLLQELGTKIRDLVSPDVWVNALYVDMVTMLSRGVNIVVSDVRFPNEAAAIKAAGGEVWRVQRVDPDSGESFDNGLGVDHPSEANVASLGYDSILIAQDLEKLSREVVHRMTVLGVEA